MILSGESTRQRTVNLLSDFIVKKIGHKSKIQIASVHNFYLVSGETDYPDPIPMGDILEEFNEKYPVFDKILNSMDCVNYVEDMEETKKISITLHNTLNPLYSHEQIMRMDDKKSFDHNIIEIPDDTPIITSFFPYGYSNDMGKTLLNHVIKIFEKIDKSNIKSLGVSFNIETPEFHVFDLSTNKWNIELSNEFMRFHKEMSDDISIIESLLLY